MVKPKPPTPFFATPKEPPSEDNITDSISKLKQEPTTTAGTPIPSPAAAEPPTSVCTEANQAMLMSSATADRFTQMHRPPSPFTPLFRKTMQPHNSANEIGTAATTEDQDSTTTTPTAHYDFSESPSFRIPMLGYFDATLTLKLDENNIATYNTKVYIQPSTHTPNFVVFDGFGHEEPHTPHAKRQRTE